MVNDRGFDIWIVDKVYFGVNGELRGGELIIR